MERCMGIWGDESRMRNPSTCLACGGVVLVRGIVACVTVNSKRSRTYPTVGMGFPTESSFKSWILRYQVLPGRS